MIHKEGRAQQSRLLAGEGLFSGWGVRTIAAVEAPYNPLRYHTGTVWPHDTAIVATGMRRYGYRDEAAELCKALFDAAEAFSNQLPEVFAGFQRDETGVPVEYPEALKPQSWAAGAPNLAHMRNVCCRSWTVCWGTPVPARRQRWMCVSSSISDTCSSPLQLSSTVSPRSMSFPDRLPERLQL